MDTQIRISATTLGELALQNSCPHCFWIKMRMGNKLPHNKVGSWRFVGL